MTSRITKLLRGKPEERGTAVLAAEPRVTQELPAPVPTPTWPTPAGGKQSYYVPPRVDGGKPPVPEIPAPPMFERFWGASIRLFQVDVLVVHVWRTLLRDRREAPALIGTFETRFARPVVLAALDEKGRPMFFGAGPIAKVLTRIPFDALAWRRYRFSSPKPVMLPIPHDPPGGDSESGASNVHEANSYLRTVVRDRDQKETQR